MRLKAPVAVVQTPIGANSREEVLAENVGDDLAPDVLLLVRPLLARLAGGLVSAGVGRTLTVRGFGVDGAELLASGLARGAGEGEGEVGMLFR